MTFFSGTICLSLDHMVEWYLFLFICFPSCYDGHGSRQLKIGIKLMLAGFSQWLKNFDNCRGIANNCLFVWPGDGVGLRWGVKHRAIHKIYTFWCIPRPPVFAMLLCDICSNWECFMRFFLTVVWGLLNLVVKVHPENIYSMITDFNAWPCLSWYYPAISRMVRVAV